MNKADQFYESNLLSMGFFGLIKNLNLERQKKQ